MVLTLEQYNYIYSLLLEHSCSATNLQTLKERFREDINSQRTFETITSINSLWKVLEKRDVLGPEHEDRLRIIVNEIVPNNQRVLEIMYGTYGRINVALQNEHPIPSTRQENLNQRVLPPPLPNVVDRINDVIQTEIGSKWRELARALAISEGRIDELEEKYARGGIRAYTREILLYHKENCGSNFELWRSVLQRALVRARRTDLSERIDRILQLEH